MYWYRRIVVRGEGRPEYGTDRGTGAWQMLKRSRHSSGIVQYSRTEYFVLTVITAHCRAIILLEDQSGGLNCFGEWDIFARVLVACFTFRNIRPTSSVRHVSWRRKKGLEVKATVLRTGTPSPPTPLRLASQLLQPTMTHSVLLVESMVLPPVRPARVNWHRLRALDCSESGSRH
jgi:hypothetical protein